MSLCALTCEELLGYNRQISEKWRVWFAANPNALDLPCDVMQTGSVRLFLQHVFAVELRYAERLAGDTPSPYEALPTETCEQLFAIHDRAAARYADFLQHADEVRLADILDMQTRSAGLIQASCRAAFVHAMLHSLRHWAQLATLMRQAGLPEVGWQDYLFYGAEKAITS